MTEAVIVATARSPIGRAVKGSLVDLRPDDMSAQIVTALMEKVPQVPASAIETGVAATHGPLDVMEATERAARARLDHTLSTLWAEDLDADGVLGDYRPLRALANAVDTFHPDQIIISTLPLEESVWHRFEVVDRARAEHSDIPVSHVVANRVPAAQSVS